MGELCRGYMNGFLQSWIKGPVTALYVDIKIAQIVNMKMKETIPLWKTDLLDLNCGSEFE